MRHDAPSIFAGHYNALPMSSTLDASAQSVDFHVRVIGAATYWQPDVMAALVAVCDHGIKFSESASHANSSPVAMAERSLSTRRTTSSGM